MKYPRKMEKDHDFFCTRCGKKGIPICRSGNMREKGHLKWLYCLNCGCTTNHAECVPNTKYDRDVFVKEYESGNFTIDGKRIISLGEWEEREFGDNYISENTDRKSADNWLELFSKRLND